MRNVFKTYLKDCYGLEEIKTCSVDAVITDPPYGISFKNNYWDKALPDKKIWSDCLRVLKPGAFTLVFSSVRLLHRLMVNIEDSGFIIKDIFFWAFLNGMPKSRNIAVDIDSLSGVESRIVGRYTYVQGYRKDGDGNYKTSSEKPKYEPVSPEGIKYRGAGLGIKPAYEPVIMVQKPLAGKLTVAQNVLKYGTGVLNIEDTRIPFASGEKKVGHNPHPGGRVTSNILRTDEFDDGYDKFFVIPKVRQNAEDYNYHPTIKPVDLMLHLTKLVTFENQIVLDPFMGTGSTGIACKSLNRGFIGYENDPGYFKIAQKRLKEFKTKI
ncbi:MAG: site-specific DNA-methyltransferase [Bacteroidota bacterium]